jgi:hypothetical protein
LEADFTRFYQQDLRALCWGETRWGVRRLLDHINYLPRDSAYVRALSGVAAYWDESVEATASVFDSVERLAYYLLRVNGNELPEPSRYPRPGEAKPVPETVSLSEFNNLLKG